MKRTRVSYTLSLFIETIKELSTKLGKPIVYNTLIVNSEKLVKDDDNKIVALDQQCNALKEENTKKEVTEKGRKDFKISRSQQDYYGVQGESS
jgi:hypothetical protein